VIRLALRCRAEQAEAVLADLLEVAPSGVEEVDAPGGREGLVEYAVYGAPGELPDLGAFHAHAGAALVEVLTEHVPDDWNERWKRFYFPVLVAGRIYVRPPWEQPAQRGGVEEVVIDPGGAFGTGTHPTTRMCLELMLEVDRKESRRPGRRRARSFCDLGCGSGVLAIAAAKLGFDPVLGIDADRAAIQESDRNARANYVELELRHVDLRRAVLPVADVVAANLTAPLLRAVAGGWDGAGERPGTLIASGLLREEVDGVAAAFAKAGLTEQNRLVSGDWAALVAT
jgi:ribosomal protein L11 methyltransferase